MGIVEQIMELFTLRGGEMYGGEAVTQLQHALQTATLAEKADAPNTLVAAALMHDIGHLVHDLPENCAEQGIDDCHERRGEKWLAQHFVQAVLEPVRLHVPAKRYLCTVHPGYHDDLSPASVKSLELQGGKMSDAEISDFESHRFYRDAVRLRRWDDRAKIVGAETSPIESFRGCIEASLISAP